MSFAVLVRDVLSSRDLVASEDLEETARVIQETLLDLLKDPAVRAETFEHAFEELDDIDMMIVHTILDALVQVLNTEEPTHA